ncbi:MAG: hypothetical protein P8X52_00095 [Limibacillus sp.]
MYFMGETEVNDIHGNFGIVAGAQLLPDYSFDVLVRGILGDLRCRHGLLAKGVCIRTRDAKQVAFDIDGKAAAE